MRFLVCGLLAALAPVPSLSAQVPPALCTSTSTPMQTELAVPRFPPLGPEALVIAMPPPLAKALSQLELREIAGQPGQYRMAVNINRAPWHTGPVGSTVVEGVYDANAQTYTYSQAIDPQTSTLRYTTERLDLSGTEFALSITHDGLTCVFDDVSNDLVYWSQRANDGDVWPDPQVVSVPGGKGAPAYGDSKIFLSDRDPITAQPLTSPQLYWAGIELSGGANTGKLVVADFVIAGGQASLQNIRTLIDGMTVFGGAAHSPHPITDGQDRVFAWLCNADLGTDGDDTILVPFINASHGWHVVYDDPDGARMNNGTSLGDSGTFIWPHNQGQTLPGDPFELCTVSLNGDNWPAATGGRVQTRVMTPYDVVNVWNVQLWLGIPSAPTPVPVALGSMLGPVGGPRPPGVLGITPLLFLPPAFVTAADPGGFTYNFRMPAIAVNIEMQAVAWNTGTNRVYLSNTARLSGQ